MSRLIGFIPCGVGKKPDLTLNDLVGELADQHGIATHHVSAWGFLRGIGLPEAMADWSLTSLQLKLIKIGARVVRHARAITFQLAEAAVTGTMAHFFVAKDREHDDRMVGVKVLDLEKMQLFESRFKGLNKPSEGEIALSMQHPKIVETYEVGLSLKREPVIVMEYIAGPSM